MRQSFVNHLIKFNRIISWILVVFAILMVLSGYNSTKHFFLRFSPGWFFLRELHLWLNWGFKVFFAAHLFVIEFFIKFRWSLVIKNLRRQATRYYQILKLLQKVTGYVLFLVSLLIVISGLNWYLVEIAYLLPLSQHTRFDNYLIPILAVHVTIGGKVALIRKRKKSMLIDIVILCVATLSILITFYIDRRAFF